ncbi:MAG: site-specific integrase [Alphaproteobacteria bacterium]
MTDDRPIQLIAKDGLDSMQSIATLMYHIKKYADQAISENTRRAYRTDLAHFEAWGGEIPSTPEMIASYLVCHAESLSIATLTRRLAAIAKAHSLQGLPSPASSELVKLTFRGIRRQHGKPQSRVAALTKEDLIVTLASIPDDLRGCRDKALLLIGFCAALRRSELCRVKAEDLGWTREGIILTLPRSKTDQTGEGRQIGIPYGRGRICPVLMLRDWLTRSGIAQGYIFRAIGNGSVEEGHLCDRSIAQIIKARAAKSGLDPARFSGHSLRAGLATSAAAAGIAAHQIRAQTGHKSDAMLSRYIREGSLFTGNAAALF